MGNDPKIEEYEEDGNGGRRHEYSDASVELHQDVGPQALARDNPPHLRKMKKLKHVGTEMALHVLAYNMKRVRGDPSIRAASRNRSVALDSLNNRVFTQPGP